ncbi:MAG: HAD-IB family hydrolase [Thermoleophilia bacterium]|nr:HAD-IB family hydrolase [Thermoleophilia bacterium]
MTLSQRPVVAAFDVDGTLTTRDCVTPFLYRTVGLHAGLALLRQPFSVSRALVRRDRDSIKATVCTAFAGMDAEAVDARGVTFAREIKRRWLRSDTFALLQQHQGLGHAVVLVSASLDPYLVPFGSSIGATGVVCTELERDLHGVLTGQLAGPNCRGPEKVRRLEKWLAASGMADAVVWAYGDSGGDDALLARADHPVRVSRRHVAVEPV